jgi:hypothetical protein
MKSKPPARSARRRLDSTRFAPLRAHISPQFSRISFGNFRRSSGVLMLLPELAGSQPNAPPENAGEQVLMAEAGCATDIGNRTVRFDEIPFCRFDADAADFSSRSAADEPHKALFQGSPRDCQLAHHIRYMNPIGGAVANESQRVSHDFVIDCQCIG